MHLEGMGMYRYSNGQISLSDFQQPMGMHLREDNRWVKKTQSIPWDKIEAKYADLFPSETGNVAKPLQLALGACLIQREYGYSDVETVLHRTCPQNTLNTDHIGENQNGGEQDQDLANHSQECGLNRLSDFLEEDTGNAATPMQGHSSRNTRILITANRYTTQTPSQTERQSFPA